MRLQQRLLGEREAAVGEERALLARELHHSIAQSLAFLKIQVQLVRSASQKADGQRVHAALDELDTGLRESINDVRELLGAEWRFVVRDDGLGFSGKSSAGQTAQVGLKVMQERATRIGAVVHLQSEAGLGTSVVLTLPAHPVSGVSLGTLNLVANALAALEMDSAASPQ